MSTAGKARALGHYTAEAQAAERHLAGESYQQITRVHRYETATCSACQGSGEDAHQVLRCCRFCGGTGETEVEVLA